jgi:hypothetical protein
MQRVRIMASQLSQLLVITENLYGNDWSCVCAFLWHHARCLFYMGYMKISLVNYATHTHSERTCSKINTLFAPTENIDSLVNFRSIPRTYSLFLSHLVCLLSQR